MSKYFTATEIARKDIFAWLKEHEREDIPAYVEHLRATYPSKGCEYDQMYYDNCITLLRLEQQYPGRVHDLVAYDFLWDLWGGALANSKKTCRSGHAYTAWNSVAGVIAREMDALFARNRQANGSGYDGSVQAIALIIALVQCMTADDSAPDAQIKIWRRWCETVAALANVPRTNPFC
jgi:hypothetical protein